MSIKRVIGAAIVAYAAFIAFQMVSNAGLLKQSAESFAAPEDSFWLYWSLLFVNFVIATSAGVLGVYFVKGNTLLFRYTVPLSGVMALFGGLSIILGLVAIGITALQRYRPNAI